MANDSDGQTCLECGQELSDALSCPVCVPRAHATELRVLPSTAGEASGTQGVRVVRQLKMPTAEHLITDPEQMADSLPDAIRSVSEALEQGDLAAADEMLDEALGAVLAGPGHPSPSLRLSFVPVVLWVWCGILVSLFLLALLWR